MATVASLCDRKDAIVAQYHDNASIVREIQHQAVEELLPALKEELDLDEEAIIAAKALLNDRVTVFRFCRRARFSHHGALKLLHATLSWRLTSSLRTLTPASISSLYLTNPLFFFHPSLMDRFGRPCAVLNLRYVQRTVDGALDALKDLVRLGWETGRRWLSDLSRRGRGDGEGEPTLQMVVIVDLEGAGMSNLEVELLPFFMDLLKNHFPGMVGAIFVLNYGWGYAGMWQLAKRVLPNTALERILFPTKEDLLEFFDEDHLLVEHGGNVKYDYTPSNPILERYGRPVHSTSSSAYPSPTPSPSVSSASLHAEMFQSALSNRPSTPSLSRRPSGLTMTAASKRTSPSSTTTPAPASGWSLGSWARPKRTEGEPEPAPLRRVRSLAELQAKLEETQREIDSEDSIGSSDEDGGSELATGTGDSVFPSSVQSARSSRFSSRATSQATSRESSPVRRRSLEPLSALGTRFGAHDMQPMSPYNASNPHFGYPAVVPPSSLDPSGIPRPHFPRRRKRDLVRTLTYLAALRFLALHRAIQWRLSVVVGAILRITGLSWWQARRVQRAERLGIALGVKEADKRQAKVHWDESRSSVPSSPPLTSSQPSSTSSFVPLQPPSRAFPSFVEIDPSYIYFLLLFLILRTPRRRDKLKALCRFIAIGAPTQAIQAARAGALRLLVGKEKARRLLQEIKYGSS
ncbi:hypothetical protein JCM21900_001620 [Sporobolomyces salmonicolor]